VVADSSAKSLLSATLDQAPEGATVMSDEWTSYNRLEERGRGHATVNHGQKEWARDDDGDGIREVHTNTIEGLWTGLRNWLRTFRGVSKQYLFGYVAAFEWSFNNKTLCPQALWEIVSTIVDHKALTHEPG
jgi:transposase-like protein